MYIVVTNDSTRVPPDLVERGVQIEQWSLGEFIDRANSDDGMDLFELHARLNLAALLLNH